MGLQVMNTRKITVGEFRRLYNNKGNDEDSAQLLNELVQIRKNIDNKNTFDGFLMVLLGRQSPNSRHCEISANEGIAASKESFSNNFIQNGNRTWNFKMENGFYNILFGDKIDGKDDRTMSAEMKGFIEKKVNLHGTIDECYQDLVKKLENSTQSTPEDRQSRLEKITKCYEAFQEKLMIEQPVIEKLFISLAKSTESLKTLSNKNDNWLKAVEDGIQIETEVSRQKFNSGQKDKPYDFISYDFINQGWAEFIENRIATANDFKKTRGRSSFLMAFFSQLSFVKVIAENGPVAIELSEFKTDDLPSETYQNTLEFLEEVVKGKYHPESLSNEIENKNLLRIKNSCRQDLRLLGFLRENNKIDDVPLNQYIDAKDKRVFLKSLIKEKPYFQMALDILKTLSDRSKNEKRKIFEEIGKLIVRNSQADNLMVVNVAQKRTTNLLRWLEYVDLIDKDWSLKLLNHSGKPHIKENNETFSSHADIINHIHTYIKCRGFLYSREEVINLYLSLKTKPFVILSGISGTGKTKMVQWFAESIGATEDNGQFNLIPIRPDWNDGSDLLGYTDIKGDFKPGPLTKIIQKAEKHEYLPYFVLLDEMNLARVEYYFSDILSVMESRKWQGNKMTSAILLSKEITGYEEDIRIPSNLYIIGTVNMDETTHSFSKKVLDRANTIDFNRVELSNLSFLNDSEEVPSIPIFNDKLSPKYLYLKDVYQVNSELIEQTSKILEEINQTLKLMNAHVGYRVRDEICFYLAYNEEEKHMEYEKALDYCILQKILPRITGSDLRVEQLLTNLYKIFTKREFEAGKDNYDSDLETAPYPNSARKVIEMLRRLHDDGFTSFWIS
jgi:hypothetical protein